MCVSAAHRIAHRHTENEIVFDDDDDDEQITKINWIEETCGAYNKKHKPTKKMLNSFCRSFPFLRTHIG